MSLPQNTSSIWQLMMKPRFIYKVFYFTALSLLLSCNSTSSDSIEFIDANPIVDGKLDAKLKYLKKRHFNYIWQFDNPVTDTVPVNYRMAYTPSHMYIYIETESDSINFRPRGYVNGDGFKFLIAKPQSDSLSDEYYDMVFSASKDKSYWARQRIWEYNHKQGSNQAFSDNTVFEATNNGKTNGFEALIAWADIPPYHPFFNHQLGYNLYFAKAIGDTITNGYAMVEDEGIWDEELPKRKFALASFEIPEDSSNNILRFQLQHNNCIEGQSMTLESVALAPSPTTSEFTLVIRKAGKPVHESPLKIDMAPEFERKQYALATENLKPGVYELELRSQKKTVFSTQFTVLPDIDLNQLKTEIENKRNQANDGGRYTLLFKLQQYEELVRDLKSYESNPQLIHLYTEVLKEFNGFTQGIDPYKNKKGPYRRAFLSKQDSTLQPYSIKLPQNYNPGKTYPLLVFLHGSGASDAGLLDSPRSHGDFIEIAPYGRDMFRAYASDDSQTDIIEAIDEVAQHFAVDTNNIVIGGFSMGGYGSLRAFYENPDLYRGVVVHAGHPNLANYWLGGDHPNFLNSKYLEVFKGKKVFVYHGKKDGALPVKEIERMIDVMQKAGIDVTYSIVRDRGHEYPDDATNALYFNWLNKLVN